MTVGWSFGAGRRRRRCRQPRSRASAAPVRRDRCRFRTQPSLNGLVRKRRTPPPAGDGTKKSAAGARAASASERAPFDSAYFTPAASRSLSVAVPPSAFLPSSPGPLWAIARANSPFASGERIRSATEIAPADWPKIVTCCRVAAEGRDVVLHPLQRRDLIEQPVVAGRVMRRFLRQLRMREEAEDARGGS